VNSPKNQASAAERSNSKEGHKNARNFSPNSQMSIDMKMARQMGKNMRGYLAL
jgi:hypothetical protein